MLCLKVRKESAEKVRKYLAKRKLSDNKYRVYGGSKFIYIPITSAANGNAIGPILKEGIAELSDRQFDPSEGSNDYRQMLQEKLGSAMDYAKGYDVIGDIAVVDARSRKSALAMARVVMNANKGIKTVLAKGGPVSGEYRTRRYVYVAGERKFTTLYRENGCVFRMDVRKVFFSPRLAYERGRVSSAVKDGENVIVMFAGVGPFAIEIARRCKKSRVVAIELNKDAYRYMVENVKLNKTDNVEPVLGDARRAASRYKDFADRIVMPLPRGSYGFIGAAAKAARRKCMVHYYAFGSRNGAAEEHSTKLSSFLSRMGARFKLVSWRTVRPYSAGEIEIVIDFELLKGAMPSHSALRHSRHVAKAK